MRALCSRGDCCLHFFDFFRWRQHGFHAERLYPQLSGPASRVRHVLVFFFLDLFMGSFQSLGDVGIRLRFNFKLNLSPKARSPGPAVQY